MPTRKMSGPPHRDRLRSTQENDPVSQKTKGPTRAGPVVDKLYARPDPGDPGGLGAEESGIERTGPTQCTFFRNSAGRSVGGSGAVL